MVPGWEASPSESTRCFRSHGIAAVAAFRVMPLRNTREAAESFLDMTSNRENGTSGIGRENDGAVPHERGIPLRRLLPGSANEHVL